MKKVIKSVLAVTLSLCLLLPFCFSSLAADSDEGKLRFDENGEFKIVVLADCQDDVFADARMFRFINDMLDKEQPDLVVFTGDNVVQDTKVLFRAAVNTLIKPLNERGIPFAYTFGNHDNEGRTYTKEYMHSVFAAAGNCLTFDADEALTGCGNCNIPVYSSKDDSMAFNLWMIDSNMYDEENGGYDYVHQDQLDWFTATDAAIEASEGHKVNSLIFQHIIVPEIYNCLVPAAPGAENSMSRFGGNWSLALNEEYASGTILEWPCPSDTNSGELATVASRGDVLGIVTGHDHVNSFIAQYNGVDLIQSAGVSFSSYGDDRVRGCSVITLNENDTSEYSFRAVRFVDYYPDNAEATASEKFSLLLSEVAAIFASLFTEISLLGKK